MAIKEMDDMNGKYLGWIEIENGIEEQSGQQQVVDYTFDRCPSCGRQFQQGQGETGGIMEIMYTDPKDPIFECGTCGDEIRSTGSVGNVQNFILNPAD